MAKMLEKRKERRIRISLPIKIVYKERIEILSKTENISRLGAYLEIDREISAGSQLEVTIVLPAYTADSSLCGQVICRASVFRSSPVRESDEKKIYGIGIFFTEFSQEAHREKLSRYIDHLISQEEREIKRGLKHWRQKRQGARMARGSAGRQGPHKDRAQDTITDLLNRVLEIYNLLKAGKK
jgi:hypothetical protein